MDLTLETPVRFVPRVGPAMAAKLDRLGIGSVRDFLYHIPFRYNDFSLTSPISRIQPGETVTVKGTVERFNAFATKTGKRVQEAKVRDDTGLLSVIWFNQPYLRSVIKPGMTIHLAGTVSWFGAKIVMNSPEYELFDTEEEASSLHTGRIVPVYPSTEGVSSKWLRSRIAFLLTQVSCQIQEFLPATIRGEHKLIGLTEAVSAIHFPKTLAEAQTARRRLAFDELFLLQLVALMQKHEREAEERATPIAPPETHIAQFVDSLPFALTSDQKTSTNEILTDLGRPFPMNRLLVGDVGSGKTVVAAIAMYAAHLSGGRAVLMAPTQILATQHYETISRFLTPFGVSVRLVTASSKPETRNAHTDVSIGTHALLSEKKRLADVGLVVIDEQHRFGVTQRTNLVQKSASGRTPHLLTMTATPIPRTVAKTVMGHMDFSLLNELPKGRNRIKTWVVPADKRENAYAWITKEIQATGGQVFIVCPLIEESESLTSVRAVKKEYGMLTRHFPEFSLGLLHGRMKPKEKTEVLDAFREKRHHILVTTPVVEVGIDIPGATIMLIEAADRFGLAQLHQLRGRVGRGTLPSYCLLFTENEDEKTITRLKLLERESSGPALADADLVTRGAGDILGVRQHGVPNLKIASFSDTPMISAAHEAARTIASLDPTIEGFPHLRQEVKKSTIQHIIED